MLEIYNGVNLDLIKEGFSVGATKWWQLTLYEGDLPDVDQLQSSFAADRNPSTGTFYNTLLYGHPDIKAVCYLLNYMKPLMLEDGVVKWPFSREITDFTKWGSGTVPKFFTLCETSQAPSGTAAIDSGIIIGSVGILGSGADLEIDAAEITQSGWLKPNDIIVDFNQM